MVLPFIEDQSIVASQTLRYGYNKSHSLMNRYFALFGFNDPVVYALGKTDRLAWFNENWNLLGKVVENKEKYYVVEFKAEALPTIGCNGFLIKKKYFDEVCSDAEQFFHIDVNYDIIKKNHNRYAIVKNDIYHITSDTFFKSITKRIKYMSVHRNKMAGNRRYKVFDSSNKNDVIRLLGFIFLSLTLIKPVIDSIRGYLKVRDVAWFIHPAICIGFLFSYGYATLFPGRSIKEI